MTLSMPTVEDCFLPLLRVLGDHGEPMVEQAALKAAKTEGFSALPSIFHIQTDKRGVPLIQRRIAWAKFYLNAAGFIQHRSRNLIQITEAGLEAINSNLCTWAVLSSSRPWGQKFGPGWLPPQAQC
jgi:restriction endonuclease Mrr